MALTTFVRLKLRTLRNGFRGRTSRVLLFVGGVLLSFYLGVVGFLLLAVSSAAGEQARLLIASLGGAVLVVGSVLFPLIWFGVDETVDPARFALLPIPRRRLVLGLFTAALISVPTAGLLLATAGLLVPAAVHGGFAAAAMQAAGVLGALLLCVAAARAVSNAFASMLRSRRVRDLAGILLACLAALLAPLQLLAINAAQRADWDRLAGAAAVIGWTPLGAPYTVGFEMAQGRPGAAATKLAITAAAVLLLLWWWSRTLEAAMVGGAGGRPGRPPRPARSGAVAQLFPRLLAPLPVNTFSAIVAREVRYWWRDAKRRANLIVITVIGILLPVLVSAGGGQLAAGATPATSHLTMLVVGAFTASVLTNQFGFDGTPYAAHLTAGVPGRPELAARATAHALLVVPLLLGVGVLVAALAGSAAVAPGAWGMLLAGYGTAVAINQLLSVIAPYPLPESANPFATASGTGLGKSLLALLAVGVTFAACTPVLVIATLLGSAWPWIAVPVGAGYGGAAAALGWYVAGNQLDQRAPELLAAVTPNR